MFRTRVTKLTKGPAVTGPLLWLLVSAVLSLFACHPSPAPADTENPGAIAAAGHGDAAADTNALFRLLPQEFTHIDFSNNLTEGLNTNVLLYEYFYNGGGVAVGDLNGDGLQDLYFSGNMTDNKLYLNKGHLQFEDITAATGVAGRPGPWKTGVSIADVNGDGRLDIFLCYSGKLPGYKRVKQLFINEGNDAAGVPHFSEQAERYGLADSSYSTQAYFFDYDRDGDLDMLLLNHNPSSLPVLNEVSTAAILKQSDPLHGVRLFRNDKGHFHDVTEQTGISSSALSYGLGAGIADMNGDGWPDIYISNDYTVPDYFYINDHKGHFVNMLSTAMGHVSQFSMGNDVADINNDGLPDIFTLDMLPGDNHRQKLLFAPDNYEKFDLNIRTGFYYQYMRNMLQLNNGNGGFSEIGQLAGISNTDWSWSPLWADYDNDGWKDLFVTNGYVRDYTNMDFIKFMEAYTKSKGRLKREDVLGIVDHMPSSGVTSYLFRNNGDSARDPGGSAQGLQFSDMGARWGIRLPSNSNGAAYVDLDNDGDLDLVVNNINQPAFVYENRASQKTNNHYLQIKLTGAGGNTQGIGAKVTLLNKGKKQYLEQQPTRGYQSTVTPILHFGLGQDVTVDTLRVVWPGGREQVLTDVRAGQLLELQEKNAGGIYHAPAASPPLFREVRPPLDFHDAAAGVNDYKRQPLMPGPMSFAGPCLVKGDVNGDGLEDIYAGAGNGQAGALYIQQKNGHFIKRPTPAFEEDKMAVDADALFFDADGDGKMDLYVASGGYHHFVPGDSLLRDRLYLGDGKGGFRRSRGALPEMTVSKSCVRAADINGDGFPDLFVGGRVIPGNYPETPRSFVLINDGKGRFADRTAEIAPGLSKIGMVTDAAWVDLNGDKRKDLILVGEWMPVTVFINDGSGQGPHGADRAGLARKSGEDLPRLVNKTRDYFDREYSGWWNKLLVGDFDRDGRPDLVIGNLGLNAQCKADGKHPAELFYKDFDGNGTLDPILCFYIGDSSYPFVTRDELLQQVGNMSKRFPDYKSYADAGLKNIFKEEELRGAGRLRADMLETAYFGGGADGKFHKKNLPAEVQFSPVYSITVLDFDKDGHDDLLLCGNSSQARLRFGKMDANYGILLKGDGRGNFGYIGQQRSGFHLRGDVRSVISVHSTLLFGMNQDSLRAYRPEAGVVR
ncbi:MAG TPA: VCBS repeat-containing protein [Puia sp.]|nr:VCBS repeat-containing protein [Puia sp.]